MVVACIQLLYAYKVGVRLIADTERLVNELIRLNRVIHRLKHGPADAPRQRSAYWLLFAIREHGPIRLADLANACHIDASTASRQTAELVAEGLLRREADPADGRASLLAITDTGEQTVRELIGRRKEFFASVLSDWDSDDVQYTADLLGRLADAIGERVDRRVPDPDETSDDVRKVAR